KAASRSRRTACVWSSQAFRNALGTTRHGTPTGLRSASQCSCHVRHRRAAIWSSSAAIPWSPKRRTTSADRSGLRTYDRAQRITLFEKEHGREFSDIFTALRHVGNLGTHAKVSRTALLNAYELYEHALSEIFGKKKKKLAALSKKLIKSRDKMK